jgi:CelD/BcsL family acetyltransferase involved in cellulose biosynthesis
VTTGAVSVDVLDGFGALPSLRDSWERIFQSRQHEPSASYEWTAAMARHHVRPDDRCRILRLDRDGRTVGLVPLVGREMSLLGRRVRLLMPLAEIYNTHSDLLLESVDDEVAAAVVTGLQRVAADWDCFRMSRLLATHPLVASLQRAFGGAGFAHAQREGVPAYVLPLPETFDRYLADRSAKFRNYLRRVTKKLTAAGVVAVHELGAGDALDQGYDAMLAVERASWKESHGTSMTAVDHQAPFYRDLMQGARDAGRLHLQWLTLDGRPLAYNLGYLTAWGYHYLKTSYDHAWRALSPATVLRARLIESLVASRVPAFDFPGDPYEWEAQWTDTVRQRTVLTSYPRTLTGLALVALDRLRGRTSRPGEVVHVDPRAARSRRATTA